MGAIAGLWCTDGRPPAGALDRMLDALSPYGPDGVGRWTGDDVALGHRAMHQVPGDIADRQPMIGRGGRLVMVADARLDNRVDLTEALGLDAVGECPSDAQLLLRAFEAWGEDCLPRLYGDYAFALWDLDRRRWLLARDGLGGRPLCWFRDHRLFAFASMPRGLHALPEIPIEADEDMLARALDLVPPDPHASCFRRISRVAMGELVVVSAHGETRRQHWDPNPEPLRLKRASDYEDALRAEMDRAVRVRLPPSGDVASHLSAGLDSGSVAATAARLLAPEDRQVVAYTAVPRRGADIRAPHGRLPDEGPVAARTAALYANMVHVRIDSGDRSPLDALAPAFEFAAQPYLNLCNQGWRDAICEDAAGRGLSVLLTGQAGNLTLSYKLHRPLSDRLRGRGLAGLLDEARALAWSTGRADLPGFILGLIARRRANRQVYAPNFLNPRRRDQLGASDETLMTRRAADSRSERLAALRTVDLANYAKATLARWRIEERDPTSDRRLVEFCLSVPDAQFRLGGMPASLARRAMADRLSPAALRHRARGLQSADWFLGFADPQRELAEQIDRLDACPATADMLDIPYMRKTIARWPTTWHLPPVNKLYRIDLLRAVSNGDFLRRSVAAAESRYSG